MAARSEWPRRGVFAAEDQGVSRQIARLRAQVAGLKAFSYSEVSKRTAGLPPGPEGSMLKLYYSQTAQSLYQQAFDVSGDSASHFQYGDEGWTRDFLYSFAMSIGGGTSEIQKEIIANRILALPR
jgi:alkylation response protein AidB-like acyl-CoA dehydrogenase